MASPAVAIAATINHNTDEPARRAADAAAARAVAAIIDCHARCTVLIFDALKHGHTAFAAALHARSNALNAANDAHEARLAAFPPAGTDADFGCCNDDNKMCCD